MTHNPACGQGDSVPPCEVSDCLAIPGLVHGFFGRHGGVSRGPFASLNMATTVGDDAAAVAANWSRVHDRLGAGTRIVRMRQVHGRRVAVVRAGQTDVGEADAMVTDVPGMALTVLSADCVPLLFASRAHGAIGVAHAGWRGSLAGIAAATVQQLEESYGIGPQELSVALGPSIGGCCYEVDDAMRSAFVALGADVATAVDCSGHARPHLDLRRINAALLRRAGIPPASLRLVGPCTQCAAGEFFSHRGHAGRTGRQVSAIVRCK